MAKYFTDFGDKTTGQQPSGWTVRFLVGDTWSVQEKGGTLGGKCLQNTKTSAGASLLAWDAPGSPAAVEILAKVRTSDVSDYTWQNCLWVRASGTVASKTGYMLWLYGPPTARLILRRWLENVATEIGEYNYSWAANTWYWIRFRASGTSLKARIWADGSAEPGEWHIDTADDAITDGGWCGVGAFNTAGTRDFDVVSVGTAGDSAASTPITMSDPLPADAEIWGNEQTSFSARYSHLNGLAGTVEVQADTVDTFNGGNLKTGSVAVNSGARGTVNLTLASRGMWYWRIRVKQGDHVTAWTTRTVVRTAASIHRVSPTANINVTAAPQEFRLVARADQGAKVKVQWQTDTVDSFNSPDLAEKESALAASGQQHQLAQHYLGAGTWHWRARAVRDDAGVSDWTTPLTLAVDTGGMLPAAVLPNPENTVHLDPLTMTVLWSASLAHVLTPTADPSLRLQVQMDTLEGFPDPETETSVRVLGGQRAEIAFPVPTGGLIWFRFRALADHGADSGWVTHLVAVAVTVQFSAEPTWERQLGPRPNRVRCRIAGTATVKTATAGGVPAGQEIDHWIEVPADTSEVQAQAAADATLATLQARPVRVEGDVPLTVLAVFGRRLTVQWWEWERFAVTRTETSEADWLAGVLFGTQAVGGDLKLALPAAPTFTRASVATKKDGSEVASGVARFEDGPWAGRKALMIEEGATNVLTANQSSVETDTTGLAAAGTGTTISRVTTDYWHGAACLRAVTPGTVVGEGFETTSRDVTPSVSHRTSVRLKGASTVRLRFVERDAADALIGETLSDPIVLTDAWQRVDVARVFGATGVKARLRVFTSVSAQAVTFYADGMMIREGLYPLSWHIGGGTRAAESLTLPAGLLSPAAGTWEAYVYVPQELYDRTDTAFLALFRIDRGIGGEGLRLRYGPHDGSWLIVAINDAGGQKTASFSKTLVPVGWRRFRVDWAAAAVNVYVDDVLRATIASPTLPSAFAGAYVGCTSAAGANNLNTLHADIRLSNIVRPNGGVWNQPLPVDEYTVYKLDLNGSLARGVSGYRTSPDLDLAPVGTASASSISWDVTAPAGTSLAVDARLDGQDDWQGCINGRPLPCVAGGQSLAGRKLELRQRLVTTDAAVEPVLHSLTAEVRGRMLPALREQHDLVLAKKVHHIAAGVATTRIYAGDYAQPPAEALAAAIAKAIRK